MEISDVEIVNSRLHPEALLPAELTPELQLILYAGRKTLGLQQQACVQNILQQKVDWERVLQLGRVHGHLPLLHHCLGKIAPNAEPDQIPVREQLYTARRSIMIWSLTLYAEQKRLCSVLTDAGVVSMPYKGVYVGQRLYEDSGLRPASDIDLLIRGEDIRVAMTALQQAGYQPETELALEAQLDFFRRTHHHFVLRTPNRRIVIELHWDVVNSRHPVSVNWPHVWRRAVESPDGYEPAAEDLLILLSIHGGRHRWESAKWITDVARLLNAPEPLDLEGALDRAAAWRAQRMLLLGLAVAQRFGLATLPGPITAIVGQDRQVLIMLDEIQALLEEPVGLHVTDETRAGFNARLNSSAWDRIRYSWGVLAHPNSEDVDEPGRSRFHYRLLRMRRMVGKHGVQRVFNIMLRLLRSS